MRSVYAGGGADSLVEPCALGVWPAAWPALKLAIANEYGARSVRPYVDSIRLWGVESLWDQVFRTPGIGSLSSSLQN